MAARDPTNDCDWRDICSTVLDNNSHFVRATLPDTVRTWIDETRSLDVKTRKVTCSDSKNRLAIMSAYMVHIVAAMQQRQSDLGAATLSRVNCLLRSSDSAVSIQQKQDADWRLRKYVLSVRSAVTLAESLERNLAQIAATSPKLNSQGLPVPFQLLKEVSVTKSTGLVSAAPEVFELRWEFRVGMIDFTATVQFKQIHDRSPYVAILYGLNETVEQHTLLVATSKWNDHQDWCFHLCNQLWEDTNTTPSPDDKQKLMHEASLIQRQFFHLCFDVVANIPGVWWKMGSSDVTCLRVSFEPNTLDKEILNFQLKASDCAMQADNRSKHGTEKGILLRILRQASDKPNVFESDEEILHETLTPEQFASLTVESPVFAPLRNFLQLEIRYARLSQPEREAIIRQQPEVVI